ncbi:rabphilin-3A [Chelonus insularis]|uniref:rabphilin-3A n=1 Tax=Chelonus insularis TaxID=460826 RepID=UPI00158C86F0|nr:rabphilin-3A-like [Chelonus insularis]XP_034937245.1 rabphilin-3A-like [Chelonus insularis]XP_034937246.1 rabphilin-3A-like [Chelonus insularis]
MDTPFYSEHKRSLSARWVCPNDRQLALRAKLKTGWSVKSGSLDYLYGDYSPYAQNDKASSNTSSTSNKKTSSLTAEEQETIIAVIQRAEALDQLEQERIGKLVERLENIKRNVTLVHTTRLNNKSCGSRCIRGNKCVCCCALCGEKFSILGPGPNICKDCRKYVCEKCCVETLTMSLPRNKKGYQQNYKNSSIPNLSSTEYLDHVDSSRALTKVFLCRICTETREMWKKSGAWFFKSLPKYILPEKKKPKGINKYKDRTVTSSIGSIEPPEPDSSSEDDLGAKSIQTFSFPSNTSLDPTDLVFPQKRNINNQPGTETLDTDNKQTVERNFSNLNQNDTYQQSVHFNYLSHNQLLVPSTSSSSTSLSSPQSLTSPSSTSKSANRLKEQKDKIISGSQTSVFYTHLSTDSAESIDGESATCSQDKISKKDCNQRTPSNEEISNEVFKYQSNGIRRHSINSDSAINDRHNDTNLKLEQEKSQIPFYKQIENIAVMHEERTYGKLEITLRYEPASQSLQCKVERARNLRPMDIHGLTDSFCKLNILPVDSNNTTVRNFRTKTVHKTRDPEFNELLYFYGITENDIRSEKALHVLVLQDDIAGRDFLGEARFPLRDLPLCQTKYYNVLLKDQYQISKEQEKITWGEDISNGRGLIYLSLNYNTDRCVLLVNIQKATNLLSMDSNGFSDPFVKLTLMQDSIQSMDDSSKHSHVKHPGSTGKKQSKLKKWIPLNTSKSSKNSYITHSTKVKWSTLNPEWNEEFAFEIPLSELTALALIITVWDKDLGKKNDFLGSLILGCSSKGARLQHWINMIKYTDHYHHASHELTGNVVFHD